MNLTTNLEASCRQGRDTQLVMNLLEKLQGGQLEIHMPNSAIVRFGTGQLKAILQVHDAAIFSQVLARGDIGFAEAYFEGYWDSPDVVAVLTLFIQNRDALKQAVYGSWHYLLAARVRHWLNRNSRAGSRRNIMAHYDLGNDFYRLWLDPSMSYSSALYRGEERLDEGAVECGDLATAQHAKYQRILSRLNAAPGQSVLEIGCGWGGFAELAVAAGLKVTGLSLSPAQLDWARKRVPQADLRLQDYRDTQQCFDHVVSIEMFEAVGERWWPSYFRTIARVLKPGGRAMIQSITIRDDLFQKYRKGTDFIQQYIFPGGMLPSDLAFRAAAARQGLVVRNEYVFGRDYAQTLAEWRRAFESNWAQIAAQGFDEKFRRLWRLYLCYCEAAFLTQNTDVVQFELAHG